MKKKAKNGEGRATCFMTFDTLTEYALFCREHADPEAVARTADNDWAGGTLEEAVTLACHGWQDGAEKSADIATRLGDVASSRLVQHEPFYDVSGFELDVGAYTTGRPECWMDVVPVESPAQGNIVTIVMSLCVSGSMNPKRMIQRGIRVAALVSALEASGRSVELWAKDYGKSGWDGGVTVGANVCIKRAGQPLDMGVVAYACAHPSMLRRLGFAFRDYATKQGVPSVDVDHGYGRVADPPVEEQGDVFVPAIETGKGFSEEQTMDWIKDILEKQGIETR